MGEGRNGQVKIKGGREKKGKKRKRRPRGEEEHTYTPKTKTSITGIALYCIIIDFIIITILLQCLRQNSIDI